MTKYVWLPSEIRNCTCPQFGSDFYKILSCFAYFHISPKYDFINNLIESHIFNSLPKKLWDALRF